MESAQGFSLVSAFPKAGAKASCPDPAMRLRFDAAPKMGTQGRLRILRAGGNTEVYSLDFKPLAEYGEKGGLSDPVPAAALVNSWPWKDTLVSREFRVHPVAIVGNEAIISLRRARLQAGVEYQIAMDAGLFVNGSEASAAVAPGEWRFTAGSPPSASAADWTIGAEGGGDFCTVQGAMDALPARNGKPVTVRLGAGTFPELVRIKSASPVTLTGQGRERTRIAYRNSETFNGGTRLRAAFGVESDQVRIFDLAIENTTPKGGSQAEALASWGDKLVVGRAHLKSFQDTFLGNGRTYIFDTFIEGDVDYLWGSGPAFLQKCRLRSLNAGYVVQARNEQGKRGFVFNQCELTAASGLSGAFLARSAGASYPYSEVVYNQCTIDGGFSAQGWKFDAGDVSKVLFAEYQSRNAQGALLNVSQRQTPGRQLSAVEARNFSEVSYVLGGSDGWRPDTVFAPATTALARPSLQTAGPGNGYSLRFEKGRLLLTDHAGPGAGRWESRLFSRRIGPLLLGRREDGKLPETAYTAY